MADPHRGSTAAALSPAERQVAEVVLRDPEAVAFGTVARVAERGGHVRAPRSSGWPPAWATPGSAGCRPPCRPAIGQQLRPAVERIRAEQGPDVVTRTLRAELDNVQRTLAAVDADGVRHRRRPAGRPAAAASLVVAGDAEAGVARCSPPRCRLVRDGVAQVAGSDVAVARQLAGAGADTVVVAIDLRRYERWVVEHVARAVAGGATVVAVTDSLLSPLAAQAAVSFTVAAEGAGVFDSHVGTLALANALVTGAAARLRRSATARLDAVEAAWRAAGALVEG